VLEVVDVDHHDRQQREVCGQQCEHCGLDDQHCANYLTIKCRVPVTFLRPWSFDYGLRACARAPQSITRLIKITPYSLDRMAANSAANRLDDHPSPDR
jgi:hypothetical protein